MKKENKSTAVEIGRNIKSLRQKIGWSQQLIAQRLGISIPAYSKIETGITDVNISRLKQICDIYNVNVSSVIPGDNGSTVIQQLRDEKESLTQELLSVRRSITDLQGKTISLYEELNGLKYGSHKVISELSDDDIRAFKGR